MSEPVVETPPVVAEAPAAPAAVVTPTPAPVVVTPTPVTPTPDTSALAAEVATWRAKAEEAEARLVAHVDFTGVLGVVDPEIVATFDSKWRALPAEGRPSRAEWVGSLRADPASAPALLRPFVAPATTVTPTPAPVVEARPPQPRVPGTPATPPSTPSAISDAEVAAIREEARRTGDFTKWKAIRDARLAPYKAIVPPRR